MKGIKMKVYNKSKRTYQHSYVDKNNDLQVINLAPKTSADIDDAIAKKWIKTGEVVEYVEPKEAKAKEAELQAEIEKLKAENAKLKEAKAKTAKK